ncbi:glycerol-3-phosphate acyltransferase 2, mitochondrial isoform X4 [Misgurnus anguillicaudatus]|uniref:glycerol-3-phosphate acyltransferase 2, mitochondrial isoform X4 n=1 Tax=Misgurnus anguillicaudatus TaxID=75329 RepID=UPI003CCF971D
MDLAGGDDSSESTLMLQPKRPAMSWGVRIKRKLKSVAPFLGRFRPLVGQCCHQCTPDSLGLKLLRKSPPLGFQNLTSVNETHTRYRGWLVRRMCCLVFVWGRDVHPSPAGDRRHNVHISERVKQALLTTGSPKEIRTTELVMSDVTGHFGRLLDLTETFISPTLLRLVSWLMLKVFSLMFCSVQVNLNQLSALHRATRLEAPLVYVCVRQSAVDQALICLALFCHNLRVPYILYPAHIRPTWLRSILQRLGVILLPEDTSSEQDAEMDSLYSPVMTSLIGELLRERASLSMGVCAGGGQGGQWLARVRQAIVNGLVPDVSIVPVGVSYDCLPQHFLRPKAGLMSAVRFVVSLLKGVHRGSVRIHFAQAFSLKEMCESGKCRVDGGRPLQELLLPVILQSRMDFIFGQKDVSWVLPSSVMPELSPLERQQTIALTLHLMYSSTTSMAVMSTSLMSCLLLHKHRKVHKDTPVCDFMKKQGVLSWKASDNPDLSSDSDCEEPDTRSYKLSQPSQCPELLFFLSSLLSVQLRALCWTLESLHYLPLPTTETACVSQLHAHLKNRAQLDKVHYESSSIDLVRMALRTFIDLGVLTEDRQGGDVYLDISPLFAQCENKEKLKQFFSQFLYN